MSAGEKSPCGAAKPSPGMDFQQDSALEYWGQVKVDNKESMKLQMPSVPGLSYLTPFSHV